MSLPQTIEPKAAQAYNMEPVPANGSYMKVEGPACLSRLEEERDTRERKKGEQQRTIDLEKDSQRLTKAIEAIIKLISASILVLPI